jgi:ATP-dependent protease HslVU (ClpYQ) peptidase subunit
MTTIVVAKKGGQVAIAADSLTTFGDTKLADHYKRVHDKILRSNGSWIGISGSSAHHLVLENVLEEMKNEVRFGSRAEIFETFRKIHPILKERCFLNPKEEDDDPYESSQITALIANATGIYAVYSYREVFDYDRFWAIGSGRNFALGAMYSIYGSARNAAEVARAGVLAGIEFDKSSSGPFEVHSARLRKDAK